MRQKIAEWINIIFGFRKFLLMLALYIVGIIFRLDNLINGSEMVDLFKTTTIAFMGANGIEHLVTSVKNVMTSKNQSTTLDDNLVPVEVDSESTNGSK